MTQPTQPVMQLHGPVHIIAGMTDEDPRHPNPYISYWTADTVPTRHGDPNG